MCDMLKETLCSFSALMIKRQCVCVHVCMLMDGKITTVESGERTIVTPGRDSQITCCCVIMCSGKHLTLYTLTSAKCNIYQ